MVTWKIKSSHKAKKNITQMSIHHGIFWIFLHKVEFLRAIKFKFSSVFLSRLNEHINSALYILGYIACNFVQMFLVISKAFIALLLKGNVMTTSCLLKILWFIPWRNWVRVPNDLIQWSSLSSLTCLFLCALLWSGICFMEYKITFSSPETSSLHYRNV